MNKKILLSAAVIVSFGIYAIRQQWLGQSTQATLQQSSVPINVATAPLTGSLPTAQPQETILSSTTTTPAGIYRDGSYTGSVADALYGPLQVKAVIQSGKLVDVQFLQYPNDRRTSIEINTQAMPILKTEAIRAQSAQVSGASGASASSDAFVQSLGAALAQAKI